MNGASSYGVPIETGQSAYWDGFSHAALARGGLAPGMRVLDIGCGAGDLTIAAASLVGPAGTVVGVDRDRECIERAARRASGAELTNVEFDTAELRLYEANGPLDALIGRCILRHLPDPAATLRRLTPALAAGAPIIFIELDWIPSRTVPAVPLVEETLGLIRGAMERAGIALDLGPRLWRVYRAIGVRDPELHVEARAEPPPAEAAVAMLTATARAFLPVMERCGLVPAGELEIGTLGARMRDALLERQAVLLPPAVTAASGRLTK